MRSLPYQEPILWLHVSAYFLSFVGISSPRFAFIDTVALGCCSRSSAMQFLREIYTLVFRCMSPCLWGCFYATRRLTSAANRRHRSLGRQSVLGSRKPMVETINIHTFPKRTPTASPPPHLFSLSVCGPHFHSGRKAVRNCFKSNTLSQSF